MPQQAELLSTQETLRVLEISRTTLYNLMKRGEIQPQKTATKARKRPPLRFLRSDVERLAQPISRAG